MTRPLSTGKTTGFLTTVALCMPTIVFAAAGGSGETTTTTKPDPAKICQAQGKVYDKETKKCVKKEAFLDQESLFESGRAFAYAGKYEEALEILSRAPDQQDSRILNLKGFSHRKLGDIGKGISYYKHSIAVDPEYALVREYYGEALLQQGNLAAAENQLKMIRAICENKSCDAYKQLHAAITDFKASGHVGKNGTTRW